MENNMLHISASPHIHSGKSTASIMRDVIIALAPASIAGAVIFGLRALLIIAVCVATCVVCEYFYNVIVKRYQSAGDLSAAVTGLLIALNVPANIPIWQCIVGSAFAIILVKCVFGGIGCNLVNPAITARIFMLVSFGSMATQAMPKIVDVTAGATPLELIAGGETPAMKDLLLGTTGGALGETCAVALILGFIYLLARRIITWHIPVVFVASVFVLSYLSEGSLETALALVLSGGLLIGAIFMATDYVTSPPTAWGKVLFGFGAGLLTFLIRKYGVYPEGVSFAILFMNILTPYIERLTSHKIFGGVK
ncbi:MAG: RnfABCDGE type electron transport complex subunit D [Clostridia bacterium]|nr:RnfABCDGE type electron transport complex subunit D [Clostridia bacterium]